MFEMPPNAMHETATTQNKASLGARVTFRPNVFSDFSEGRGSPEPFDSSFSVKVFEPGQDTEIASEDDGSMKSAMNSRELNREQVRKTLLPREKELISNRQALVYKSLKTSLDRAEQSRLKYLNWQLDQIDDAKLGEHFDRLETIIERQAKTTQAVLESVAAIKASCSR